MNTIFSMGLALSLVGCGGFIPEEGEWTVNSSETVSNTCGFEDEEDTGSNEEDTFIISSTDDGGYNIDLDEDITLYCLLDKKDMTCESFEFTEDIVEMAITTTQIMNYSGSFASETKFNGTLKVDMDCIGDGCSMLEMFGITVPCTAEMIMLASK